MNIRPNTRRPQPAASSDMSTAQNAADKQRVYDLPELDVTATKLEMVTAINALAQFCRSQNSG